MGGELAAGGGLGGGPLLEVKDLSVAFPVNGREVRVVDRISYRMAPRRTLGVVGESGCGKTVAALALLRLVPPPGRIVAGTAVFEGRDLMQLSRAEMQTVRGARIAMVFQEPMTSLNPVLTVGEQIAESLTIHGKAGAREARVRAAELMATVGIPDPARRADDYPHQLSGGMRQRVMIAMAFACRPALLIADEPTTALDVTVQAQILELMLGLQEDVGMAIQFISHNLGVISEMADEVIVIYAGRVVERATSAELFQAPLHPYTRGLLETVPQVGGGRARLATIPGRVPEAGGRPRGCAFRDRCPLAEARCAEAEPALEPVTPDHAVACFVTGR